MAKVILFFLMGNLSLCIMTVNAATVEVSWLEPDKYRDIRSEGEKKDVYREQVFSELNQHFSLLAQAIPHEHVLQIKVSDLDLAGDINTDNLKTQRVIMPKNSPRIKFTYQLINTAGEVVKAGGVNLKKLNFFEATEADFKKQTLGYEKFMISEWFNFTFLPR